MLRDAATSAGWSPRRPISQYVGLYTFGASGGMPGAGLPSEEGLRAVTTEELKMMKYTLRLEYLMSSMLSLLGWRAA